MDAEKWHDAALGILEAAERFSPLQYGLSALFRRRYPRLSAKVFDIDFPNPVGLAAGWDKNARVPNALAALGFGFTELGTVTLWPEKGNPRPRVWRSFKRKTIINRVAFANDGCVEISARLKKKKAAGFLAPVGVSLGKMPSSGAEELPREISAMLQPFYSCADFFTINVSSPNTPRGFLMGGAAYLRRAFEHIQHSNRNVAQRLNAPVKPLLLKIAPTLEESAVEEISGAVLETGVSGVIATNTAPTPYGGLSGLPLKPMSLKTAALLYKYLGGKVPVVGVGGILTPQDAWERISAGASLIQLFSGFVFSGPGVIGRILGYLDSKLKERGMENISQAVGIESHKYR